MPKRPIRRYLESSVFIALLKGESGRAEVVQTILEAAERGDTEVVISPIVVAEVVRTPEGSRPSTPEEEQTIRDYFRHSFIKVTPVTTREGELARDLYLRHGLKKPLDALHLACALSAECDVLETYDSQHLLRLPQPPIRIGEPQWDGDIPMLAEDTQL